MGRTVGLDVKMKGIAAPIANRTQDTQRQAVSLLTELPYSMSRQATRPQAVTVACNLLFRYFLVCLCLQLL
jgi:hypothetical protein